MKFLILVGALIGVLSASRMKVGGWTKQEVKNGEWMTKLMSLQDDHNLLTFRKQPKLISVSTQLVSGMNYKFKFTIGKKICRLSYYEQVWTNTTEILKDSCNLQNLPMKVKQDKPKSKMLLGGWEPVRDFSSPGVQKCLALALDSVSQQSNSYNRLVETNVRGVQQVVSGIKYKLQFTVAESSCLNTETFMGKTAKDCPVSSANGGSQERWITKCLYQAGVTDQAKTELLALSKSPAAASAKSQKKTKTRKLLLGQDGHDLKRHGRNLLALDMNYLIDSSKKLLGGDVHDFVEHGKKLIGQDGHDLIEHGQKLLGGDGHDLIDHGQKLLGGDGHDFIEHGKKLLGGDGHDFIEHGQKLLGQDGHDIIEHGKKLLGGDGHDFIKHGQKLLGGDGHDFIKHGQKLLGGDGHDFIEHGQKLLGGDGHDFIKHGQKLLGGDGHDYVEHGKKLLGGDGHDTVQHAIRQGGSDRKNKTKLLGGDGHDDCHIGMFKDFKSQFNKLYGSQKEEEKRYMTFCDNMRMVRKLQTTEKGSAVYGATKFADLTKEEFKHHVGKRWDQTANQGMKKAEIPKGPVPDQFDWRDHGAVTAVKNQGSCGSCWAFSTTGNIEGQWAIQKKKLISLSEQELVDCDKLDEGCNGGLPSNAYKEIERLGGLETEDEYTYKGEDEKCGFIKKDVKVYINSSVSISKNETDMAAWLFKNGPISIGINAFAMQFYMGGISHPWKMFCSPSELDHGVLIVGYGVKDTEPFWIVKNSWGPDWGEQGYYLVYRGDGVCGLNTMCTSAVVN